MCGPAAADLEFEKSPRYIRLRKSKNKFSAMKKMNWARVALFLLTVAMFIMEGCRLFKPKCDCPHF